MPGNIQNIPLSVIATWPRPNYVDPIRRSWLPTFAMVWQIAATILVWGRFYLRAKKQAGPFGLDDVFMLLAWIFAVGLTVCAWIDAEWYGLDRHTWDIPVDEYTKAALVGWIAQGLMTLSTGATKASVLLFYRRMVVDTFTRRWKVAIYIALAFHAFTVVGVVIALLLVCRPLQAYWMSYDFTWHKSYKCTPADALNPIVGVLSVLTDLYAVVLPCVILQHYQLDVPKRQKIALNCIFALGLLVVGAGIAKTYYLVRLGQSYDTSWAGFDLYVWAIIECQLGIICACAPSMRAFFRRYLMESMQRTFGSADHRRSMGTKQSATLSHQSNALSGQRGSFRLDAKHNIDVWEMTTPSLDRSAAAVAQDGRSEWESEAPNSPVSRTLSFHTLGGTSSLSPIVWESGNSRPWSFALDRGGSRKVKEIQMTV